MNEKDSIEEVKKRLFTLETHLEDVYKKINDLQTENQELRRLVLSRNDFFNFKRPGNFSGLDNTSCKKFKFNSETITPEVKVLQENKPKIDGSANSSQRRQVVEDILKDFRGNIMPRYQDHLINERNQLPKLRSNDGKIILKNIRYIR